jgi:hypothetical protein
VSFEFSNSVIVLNSGDEEYPEELATVKEALFATYNDYPDSKYCVPWSDTTKSLYAIEETMTALFHQMAQTVEVRSVAIEYLITTLIPKGLSPALETLLGERIIKVFTFLP